MAQAEAEREPTPLLYAVTREDARLEGDLVMRLGAKTVLCPVGGGCVPLTLTSRFPELSVTGFDRNPAQLAHIVEKAAAVNARDMRALNVEHASRRGLNQRGELERVFRMLRAFFEEFIAPHAELLAFFTRAFPLPELDRMVRRWTSSRYFPAAFHACFSEVLIRTTVGSRSLRWSEVGSDPEYFQKALERGLRGDAAPENPFLQHIFLGGYRRGCEPYYVRNPVPFRVELVEGSLLDVQRLERFDIVTLSNLLDGLSDEEVERWATELRSRLRPGSAILLRQLNNTRPLRPFFEPAFRFDEVLGHSYRQRDRSLFYNRIEVGVRV